MTGLPQYGQRIRLTSNPFLFFFVCFFKLITSVWIKEKPEGLQKGIQSQSAGFLVSSNKLTLYVFKQPSGYDIQMTCVVVDRSVRKIRDGSLTPLEPGLTLYLNVPKA